MAVIYNTQTTGDVVKSLDLEFVKNFQGEYDRFSEIVGLFQPDVVAAGTALYQYNVAGALVDGANYVPTADAAVDATKTYYARSGEAPSYAYAAVAEPSDSDVSSYYELRSSSGTGYVEGDFIARSKYTLEKTPVGEVEFYPYAKQTTAQAILKAGFERAVLRTDRKAQQQVRASILNDFFALLAKGTSTASPDEGKTWYLQELLAMVSAKLGDVMEANDEEPGRVLYFVNRQDAASYLGAAPITTQESFGMTYLESFLGVQNVMLTNKVAQGTAYATPVENVHAYGLDFGSLGQAGLSYETGDFGLVGVHHDATYDYGSAETYIVRGAKFVPEVTDFIVKGSTTHLA